MLSLFFPERCPACDAFTDGPGLCARCAVSLYALGAACPVCARPEEGSLGVTCRRCRRSPPPFARASAPWRYGGELATALRRLKYGGRRGAGRADVARPLAALLAPAFAAAAAEVDLVVPVPLSPRRLRRRGFSQAQALAALARGRDAPPLAPAALVRVRETAEQAGLGLAERRLNVARAFAVPARAGRRVLGRRVLLVDDVLTTGATAAACARALRAAGAFRVDVLALARAD